ncbi:GNAT family N-acetyltransferase [Bosea sp. (in: a-proteobacteria)]|uniref:GNAT family N-acetyltransferase n=1 Tax=Bosea sp. (in: a-proteobacteria) TaxID=1871050 RepID=UPI0026026FA2|nr:GNAT family N-acetyltransferase [Bosea sp. (in: a-proteobacteria)]MCO5092329.1 GNAT family N-acetyltransferase [Bosea sp. (in: a-proteobacteria)]
MPEITIRPLAATDRDAWTPLWHGYLAFYKATLPPAVDAITFGRLTGGSEPMGGFIAFRGDEALGMVNWVIHRSTWSERNICYLQDLFTVPEARGSGVGRGLIEAVNGMAREKGCFRVYWQTQESNLQARELYDKVADKSGFIVYRQPLD